MAGNNVKDPYNIYYFLGFIALLLIPMIPAILTWYRVANGYVIL